MSIAYMLPSEIESLVRRHGGRLAFEVVALITGRTGFGSKEAEAAAHNQVHVMAEEVARDGRARYRRRQSVGGIAGPRATRPIVRGSFKPSRRWMPGKS